jgi:hypothetical protein
MEQQWIGFIQMSNAYLLSMAQIWRMLDMRPTSAQMGPTSAPDINQQLTHLQNQLNERLS